MDIATTTARFFLAAVIILITCRLVAMAARRLGQPPVVGEMIAGVLLGPSLLGLVLPGVQNALFPDAVRPMIYVVSHIGLVAFMFGVGHEFAQQKVRGLGRPAATVSLAGVTAPLVLGVAFILLVHGHADILKDGVPVGVSALFVGVALAITAFPMLARIISERNLTGSRLGSLSLAAGAIDDGVAWILLALTIGLATGDPNKILVTGGGTLLFVLALWFGVRPALNWIMARPGAAVEHLVLVTAVALFAAAWWTDLIGLYSVFGGFCLGFIFPRTEIGNRVVAAISPVTKIVFLPLFFAYSGLNTEFGLLFTLPLLLVSLGCVAVAILGKFGACWFGGRLAGEENSVAIRVGVLMNARGLMQLIALNVGLQTGIVTPALFSALVLVAIVTTVMTAPWLSWLDRRAERRQAKREMSSVAAG
ncbi:Kef-type K+ transport system membrane component KefB [Kibdelosporangium banguiense]|uniref:Kef-type K+ transport system membrane component KefB n=1 Tax=Kibdelosporangium banguiense TaxID=1365924 RepID=A0ABS4U0Q1_9PSEU|nr:cation:proton antiporter [Kibdelosporangium banguiense]MBP2330229.1 Kef-type K+ transport system membrane component KefB [Kibdelosporangium banguiense]